MSGRLVVLTGLSGSGKTTALHALEDIGFYTVDNLLPALWEGLVDAAGGGENAIAIGVDIRTRAFLAAAPAALAALRGRGLVVTVVFLDASDPTLVRRYNFTRRTHPLAEGTLTADLTQERRALEGIRALADVVIDTTATSARDLTQDLWDRFGQEGDFLLRVLSFGYKRGVPTDVDSVLDVRALPNPYYDPTLKPLPGTSPEVQSFVFTPSSFELYTRLRELVRVLAAGARTEGRSSYSVAIGCTGGQHRSVAVAERLTHDLADTFRTRAQHRDLEEALRENA
jgi:UPF0042 nucleotide-binding protein